MRRVLQTVMDVHANPSTVLNVAVARARIKPRMRRAR